MMEPMKVAGLGLLLAGQTAVNLVSMQVVLKAVQLDEKMVVD